MKDKPTRSQLEHLYFKIWHDVEVINKTSIPKLRYLVKLINGVLLGVEPEISNGMQLATINSEGLLEPLDDTFPEEHLKHYSEIILKKILDPSWMVSKDRDSYRGTGQSMIIKVNDKYELSPKAKWIASGAYEIDSKRNIQVNEIALIHAYEKKQITRENADQIAADYGWTSKSSGEGLFQDYMFYKSSANRKGIPKDCTNRKLKNKIQLLEGVLKHLSVKAKRMAEDEIRVLKSLRCVD